MGWWRTAAVVASVAVSGTLAGAAGPTAVATDAAPEQPVLVGTFDLPDDAGHDHAAGLDEPGDRPARLADPSPGTLLAGMNPLTPGRVLDTRDGTGVAAPGPLVAGGVIRLAVRGLAGVPGSGVDAVALNVTVTGATEPSFLTVWPSGSPLLRASNLNMAPGQTVPNLVIAKLGPDGSISIANGHGAVHVIADVVGWSGAAAFVTTLTPVRVLDTRDGTGAPAAAVGPGGVVELSVTGTQGVPASGGRRGRAERHRHGRHVADVRDRLADRHRPARRIQPQRAAR